MKKSSPVARNSAKTFVTPAIQSAYSIDPCCAAIPPMHHDEYQSLKASLLRNGQLDPILIFQDRIIDGRHRFSACNELGIKPAFKQFVGTYEDAKSMAFSVNINRRQLTMGQKALVAAKLTMPSIGEGKSGNRAGIPAPLTQVEAAALFGISRDTVQRGCTLLREADPALIEEVRNASCGLHAAIESLKSNKGVRAALSLEERRALRVAAEVKSKINADSRTKRLNMQSAISQKNMALPKAKYAVVLADPPWNYGMANERSGNSHIPQNHYPTMSTDDICAMPVTEMLADDAMLYLWCPASLLPDGLRVMQSWGFDQFVTSWVWHKTGGKLTCAGGTALARHELLLIGKKRNGLTIAGTAVRASSVFEAPVTQHSEKPAVVHHRIETLYPGVINRIELFARTPRTGWDVFGNQSEGNAVPVAGMVSANDDVMRVAMEGGK
jgi:N6-adenosine-specific RNA methylase IME4